MLDLFLKDESTGIQKILMCWCLVQPSHVCKVANTNCKSVIGFPSLYMSKAEYNEESFWIM